MKYRSDMQVDLVQSWGTDELIAQAARVSTGSESTEKIKGLIGYLLRNAHCYDDQTEVLTDDGWKLFKDLDRTERVLTRTQEGEIEWVTPTDYIVQLYEGEMVQFKGRNLDLLVTPNHRMFAEHRTKQGWQKAGIHLAEEFNDRAYRVLRGGGRKKGKTVPYEEAWMLGFVIADAHVGRSSISFHLKKERKIRNLKYYGGEGITSNGDTYRLSTGWREGFFDLAKKTYLKGGSRIIPSEVLDEWDSESLFALMDGLIEGDGYRAPKGRISIKTVSPALAESIQTLCALAGTAATINGPFDYGKGSVEDGFCETYQPIYNVVLASRRNLKVRVGWTLENRAKQVQRINYSGRIYCVTVPSGIIYVRRNGQTMWSGNSSPFEHVGATFRVEAPMFVRDQWVRHRTQSYNIKSLRFSEADPEFYMPPVERPLVNEGSGAHPRLVEGSVGQGFSAWASHENIAKKAWYEYTTMLEDGVAEEVARNVLPASTYTAFYVSANLWNWLRFIDLRITSEQSASQWEISDAALQVAAYLEDLFPVTMDAWAK